MKQDNEPAGQLIASASRIQFTVVEEVGDPVWKPRLLLLLEPPWRHSGEPEDAWIHWFVWVVGWVWTLAGLVLGAVLAPELLQVTRLTDSTYHDILVIAISLFAGLSVQIVGWCLLLLTLMVFGLVGMFIDGLLGTLARHGRKPTLFSDDGRAAVVMAVVGILPGTLLPLAGVGYGIYRYLTWIGAGQREVTIAFAGALLVKTFAIPLIKGIVTGALFRWFMKWLRVGKDTKKAT